MHNDFPVVALKTRGIIKEDTDYWVTGRMVGAVQLRDHEGWYPESWFRRLGNITHDLAGDPLPGCEGLVNHDADDVTQNVTPGDSMDAKERYLKLHAEYCNRMIETTKRKNHDYTGTNADPFANFRAVEASGICSTEQGFLVRMTDKIARITSFVQKGVLQVADESVEDTLLDLANYSLLLAGFIREEKERERGKNENADSSNGDEIPF